MGIIGEFIENELIWQLTNVTWDNKIFYQPNGL